MKDQTNLLRARSEKAHQTASLQSKSEITVCDSREYRFPPIKLSKLKWFTEKDLPPEVIVLDFERLLKNQDLDLLAKTLTGEKILVLKNHPITEQELEDIVNVTRQFFDQKEEDRRKMIHPRLSRLIRGFSGFNSEHMVSIDYDAKRDGIADPILKYSWGPEDNLYPNEKFKQIWDNYFKKCYFISTTLIEKIIDILDLKKDPQWKKMFNGDGTVRLACYPEVENVTSDRFKLHLDMGFITLNNQLPSENGFTCLQVEHDAKLISVPAVKNLLVVNYNEHLGLFTNNRVKPVVHQVISPPREEVKDSERSSVLFFLHPHDDLITKNPKESGLKQCYSEGSQTKFSDFMRRWLDLI